MRYRSFIVILLLSISCALAQTDSLHICFKNDTARVERYYRSLIEKDSSIGGTMNANFELEREYNILLDKYYKILCETLDTSSKRAFIESHEIWIKLKDSDRKLLSGLKRNKVFDDAGGENTWKVVASYKMANLTRQRLLDLYYFFNPFQL